MALVLKDRVKVTSSSTGTGTFTLGSAAIGFQDFAAIGDGNTTYYTIALQSGTEWEVGIGTVTDTGGGIYTLSRNTILESSNAGSAVNFSAGTKDVFVTYPAERSVYLNAAGSAVDVLDIGTVGATTANITTANITAGTVATSPVSANDLVNKSYVDTIVASGIHFHEPVRVESPINLNATYDNGTAGVGATLTNAGTQVALVIDGITMVVADRVLVYEQTDQTQNGVYVVTSIGSGATNWILTRASDADTFGFAGPDTLSEGSTFFVQEGATGAGETYTCNTVGTITFGTTNITFAQVSSAQIYSAGTGLTLSGTQFSITNTGTAGTYGSASQAPVFTTNAQGQVTAVTNTAIAITSAAVSGLAASATTDTTNAANITSGTLPVARLNGSYTGITGVGTLAAGTWNASTIGAGFGGTGLSSYDVGDLLYADGTTSLAKLAGVATGNALISGGVGTAPAWGKIGLNTHVSGTLPIGNGGTGETTASAAINALAPSQTGNAGKYLSTNGTAVSWEPSSSANYVYRTSNYSAASNDVVLTDTSGGGFTVILPATPVLGSTVIVADAASSWGTNNLIVERNGSTIDGAASNLTCDIDGVSVQLIYDGITWNVYAQVGAGLAQIAANVLYSNTTSGLTATDVQAAIDELSAEKLEVNNPSYTGTLTGGAGSFTSLANSGNLAFTGTGNRITGDFSNATIANRVAFQTSTANGNTILEVIPNGTGNTTSILCETDAGLVNTSFAQVLSTTTEVSFRSGIRGTGSYLPITFQTGGSERVRIDTSGNVGIGTSSPASRLHVASSTSATALTVGNSSGSSEWQQNGNDLFISNYNASGAAILRTNGTERMRIDSAGNVGIGTSSPGPFGKLEVVGSGYVATRVASADASGVNAVLVANGANECRLNVISNHPLAFYTNATEHMRITSAGNVGIGTSSPGARLVVNDPSSANTFPLVLSNSISGIAIATAGMQFVAHGVNFAQVVGGQQTNDTFADGNLRFFTRGSEVVSERMRIDSSGMVLPGANNTYDLGSTSLRWRNIYTNDLHLSNEGSKNSVDGTWGDWTIQEGETDLYLLNNRSGKRYKFALTEVPQE